VKPRITPPAVNGHQGAKDVKFSKKTGHSTSTSVGEATHANADGSGPCQVCHTRTKDKGGNPRWRNSGNSDPAHYAAGGANGTQSCVGECHSHSGGFAHGYGGVICADCHGHDAGWQGNAKLGKGTYQSHSTHTENDADDVRGPFIACAACHATGSYPSFRSGVDADGNGVIDLGETDVCDGCHSAGGPYDGVGDPAIGAKVNWRTGVYAGVALVPGKERWCVGCHDGGASVIPAGTGRAAPPVAGDGTTYGYYVNGHGSRSTECGACHDLASNHNFDGKKTYAGASNNYQQGYRLATVNGGAPLRIPNTTASCTLTPSNYALCLSCHDVARLFRDMRPRGVYGCRGNPYVNAPTIDTGFRNMHPAGLYSGNDMFDLPGSIHADHLLDGNVYGIHWYSDEIREGTPNSLISCPTCHDAHGDRKSDGAAAPRMTKGVYGVVHSSDSIGTYGQLGSRAWLDDPARRTCNVACHWGGGGERWYKDAVPAVRTFTIADANPADPSAPDAGFTNARTIRATLNAFLEPLEMQFAEDASFSSATAWAPFSTSTTYTLTSPGDGLKTVYFRVRNASGASLASSATITLDTASPVATLTAPNGGDVYTPLTARLVTWSLATDANLRPNPIALEYSLDDGASYLGFAANELNDGSFSWVVPVVHSPTARVRIAATDRAGNRGTDASDATFTIP
jgi:hypothetical protein